MGSFSIRIVLLGTLQRVAAVLWRRARRWAALLLLGLCLPLYAAPLRVNVLLSEAGGSYSELAGALRDALDAGAFTLTIGTSAAPPESTDLYVAVGMKASLAVSHSTRPVLSVWTPRATVDAIKRPAFSALYMEQPIARHWALLRAALPEVRAVGVLYATLPMELPGLRRLARADGLVLHEQVVTEPAQLGANLAELIGKSDVLLALPDAAIYRRDTIRNILLQTYRQRVPLIGISRNYVQAGALCSVYSSPVQVAHQAAGAIEYFAANGHLPASQYPQEFEVSVNTQVARSLGLTIKDAAQLRAAIGWGG